MLAQNLASSDAGTAVTQAAGRDAGLSVTQGASRDGGASAKLPLRFDVITLNPPKKQSDGQYAYQEILDRHSFRFLELTAGAAVAVPDGATPRGKVVVGFIQNLVSREMKYQYAGRKLESWKYAKGPLLDAADVTKDWPWYGPDPFSKSIDYKPGETVTVFYDDFPGAAYWNYFGNSKANGELLSVQEILDLQLWLAAREEKDAARDAAAYSILWSRRFILEAKLTITKTLSQLRAEADRKGQNFYRSLGSPEYKFEANVKDNGEAGPTPVLNGPTANQELNKSAIKTVYAELRPPHSGK